MSPVDLARQFMTADYAIVRERNLTMPGKIADSLTPHTPKDRAEIERIIRLEVNETLNELHDPAKFDDASADDAGRSSELAEVYREKNSHLCSIRDSH
jgi:hypothetical protein